MTTLLCACMSDLSLFIGMKPQRLLTMSEVCKFDGSKREKTNGSKRENLTVLSEAPPLHDGQQIILKISKTDKDHTQRHDVTQLSLRLHRDVEQAVESPAA